MQHKLQFIKGYQKDDCYRQSFNELAKQTFGINFEDWYKNGYWTEKYEPFSYADGDKVVANVSVNKLHLILQGEDVRALQIGTVMTHPDYRNQGLSRELMNRVMEEYEGTYEIMYLFANQSVLDFYPKFGFQRIEEYQYSLSFAGNGNRTGNLRKLDGNNPDDLRFVYEFVKQRAPVSQLFGTANAAELFMFYCTYVFSQDLYYLEEEDVLVLFKQEDDQINVFDVISRKEIDLHHILNQIVPKGSNEIVFHFTPAIDSLQLQKQPYQGSGVFFVLGNGISKLPAYGMHPLTSQA